MKTNRHRTIYTATYLIGEDATHQDFISLDALRSVMAERNITLPSDTTILGAIDRETMYINERQGIIIDTSVASIPARI